MFHYFQCFMLYLGQYFNLCAKHSIYSFSVASLLFSLTHQICKSSPPFSSNPTFTNSFCHSCSAKSPVDVVRSTHVKDGWLSYLQHVAEHQLIFRCNKFHQYHGESFRYRMLFTPFLVTSDKYLIPFCLHFIHRKKYKIKIQNLQNHMVQISHGKLKR